MVMSKLGIELSNISIPYPVFRGNYPGMKTTIPRRILPLSPSTFISYSIHNLSHIDLPFCLDNQMDEINKNYGTKFKHLPGFDEIDDVLLSYSQIKRFRAVIINLENKREALQKYIDKETGLIRRETSCDVFYELMKILEIKECDFKIPLDNLKDSIIIFKTGFDKFFIKAIDYNSPYFELRYPYLTHPYISNEEFLWELIDEYNVAGLGSDTYGLENPIYFVNKHEMPNYAKYYYKKIKDNLVNYRPVLTKLMSERKIYIKNLKNIKTKSVNHAVGTLTVIPFALGNNDANVVRVFFKED